MRTMIIGFALCVVTGLYQPLQAQSEQNLPLKCVNGLVLGPCVVQLAAGQSSALVTFTPTDDAGDSRNERIPLTVTATKCCLDSTTVYLDGNGFASIHWKGSAASDTIHLSVRRRYPDNILRVGDITLIPAQPQPLRHVALVRGERSHAYVWIRGEHIPSPVHVEVAGVWNGTTVTPLTESDCSKLKFTFVALNEGKISPDSGTAVYATSLHSVRTGKSEQLLYVEGANPMSGRGGVCTVRGRWKLPDAPGGQELQVTISGEGLVPEALSLRGIPRQAPRITAGYGYFVHLRRDREITCTQTTQQPLCEGKTDSSVVKTVESKSSGEPYFAFEFPFFYRYNVNAKAGQWAFEHVRLMVGSTFERPQDNYFVGLTLSPILSAASEHSPFQLSAGVVGPLRGVYSGFSLDTSQVIQPILSVFGLAK